jgi:hypothetical protein
MPVRRAPVRASMGPGVRVVRDRRHPGRDRPWRRARRTRGPGCWRGGAERGGWRAGRKAASAERRATPYTELNANNVRWGVVGGKKCRATLRDLSMRTACCQRANWGRFVWTSEFQSPLAPTRHLLAGAAPRRHRLDTG